MLDSAMRSDRLDEINFKLLDIKQLSKMEWLVTNGIGGFASGTVSGVLTRRYHGYLIAALDPPVKRVNMLAKFDEVVQYKGQRFAFSSNLCQLNEGEAEIQAGCDGLSRFHLDGSIPTWTFKFDSAVFRKQIWMEQGENTTYVLYTYLAGEDEIILNLEAYCCYSDFHHTNKISSPYTLRIQKNGLSVKADKKAKEYFMLSNSSGISSKNGKECVCYLSEEDYRGMDAHSSFYQRGFLSSKLHPGQSLTAVITTNPHADIDGLSAYSRRKDREFSLLLKSKQENAPNWIQQLVLAADQFVVERSIGKQDGYSVIAGYPWFSDWGRDTMIALPGLALSTRRFNLAESILRTFAKYVDQGMLPNRFPDLGEEPEYNTIDATLWYFEAIYKTYKAISGIDPRRALGLIKELFPILGNIIEYHIKGTRFNIKMDPNDGLLSGGESGVQLTWMDAKVNGYVVTPRDGKPIEINALWHSALIIMAEFAKILGEEVKYYNNIARRVCQSFERFWNQDFDYCFDALDGTNGDDDTLRPNQVLAVSVSFPPLSIERQKKILLTCEQFLLTPVGLRSLATNQKNYVGKYGGDIWDRDTAYHQGTIWGWLIGPYLSSYLRIFGDREYVHRYLREFVDQINYHGLGSISEIFDGDYPHTPRGCIAQAWSVASALQVWSELSQ